ncbi:MAG TPA: TIGR02281 family clan AA aspartic protease [Stellaceae bacterium]|nr:TIGR02281 family clan AA aspartic protease [Stellaceae bacterium]
MSDAYGPSGGQLLRRAFLWTIGCGAAAYAVPRLMGSSRPSEVEVADPGATRQAPRPGAAPDEPMRESYRAGPGNQFIIDVAVNGIPIRFMVDTGATEVSLVPGDAQKLGFNLDRLQWNVATQTANGNAVNAAVTLAEIRLGAVTEYGVPALVMRAGGGLSLLGMSFLSRLKSWQIHDGVLTIAG